jgi:hypothetical protein
MKFTIAQSAPIQARPELKIALITALSLLHLEPHKVKLKTVEVQASRLQKAFPLLTQQQQPQLRPWEPFDFRFAITQTIHRNLFEFMLQVVNAENLSNASLLKLDSITPIESTKRVEPFQLGYRFIDPKYLIKFTLEIRNKMPFYAAIIVTPPHYHINFHKNSDTRLLPEVPKIIYRPQAVIPPCQQQPLSQETTAWFQQYGVVPPKHAYETAF